MKHLLKYIIVFLFAALLAYVLLVAFVHSALMVWVLSAICGIGIVFLLRKLIAKYNFSFVFMVSVFLFVLTAPLLGKKETTSLENRTLAPFPVFDINYIWGFTYGFSDYLNDKFAYRNASIAFIGKLKYHVFRKSPRPERVDIGKDTFLFYPSFDDVHNISEPFTQEELANIRRNLEIMTKWFDLRGIKYYFTVPPAKEHIYPELESPLMQVRTRFSRLNQLADYIKDDTLIRFIDYRKEIIENKKTRLTYLETDSHWNRFGAFFGYHKIMERIHRDFPSVKVAELADYRMDSSVNYAGDLQLQLGFDDLFTLHYYYFTPKNGARPVIADSMEYNKRDAHAEVREMPLSAPDNNDNIGACKLKLLVVRDSYTEALKGFFSTQFKRTVYIWTKKPPIDIINKEHPDIILHEVLERFIHTTLLLPDEIAHDTIFMKQYFPGYYKKKPSGN